MLVHGGVKHEQETKMCISYLKAEVSICQRIRMTMFCCAASKGILYPPPLGGTVYLHNSPLSSVSTGSVSLSLMNISLLIKLSSCSSLGNT